VEVNALFLGGATELLHQEYRNGQNGERENSGVDQIVEISGAGMRRFVRRRT